jgi:NADH-quinone oxidoreductase subunit B
MEVNEERPESEGGNQPPDTLPPEPPAQPSVESVREGAAQVAADAGAVAEAPEPPVVAEASTEVSSAPGRSEPPVTPAAETGAPAAPARPMAVTSAVPGRVPAPAVEEEVTMAPVRHSMGVQLEMARLTPVELEQPKALYRSILPGIMQVPADYIIAAARKSSLWPMTFGLACCAIEMIATYMAHHDLDRFGIVPWPSPRQCDVMIVAGTVTKKMAPAVKLLYEQMPNPKWVISMGACATNGGPYTRYDRVLQGVDKIIPVDVYVPGCPPRPEALIDGLIALQNKIMEERSRVG